jgi:hypothetical protein
MSGIRRRQFIMLLGSAAAAGIAHAPALLRCRPIHMQCVRAPGNKAIL